MDEISNKTLATLLVVAIVISLTGTFFAMRGVSQVTNIVSGHAVGGQGTAQVNISQVVEISLVNDAVNFGTGSRNGSVVNSDTECNITSNQTTAPTNCWQYTSAGNDNFDAVQPFHLENIGNTFVNLTINSTNYSNYFGDLGTGTGTPRYMWTPSDGNEGTFTQGENGCTASLSTTAWTNFDETEQNVCPRFNFENANDEMFVDILLGINHGMEGVKNENVVFFIYRVD
ncbi:hypothetical protein HQ545_08930 [Candidatus Woesearchaeota archaeon]|nr:hypothetical protein [Candidatus Woesearchaeota archaeon]